MAKESKNKAAKPVQMDFTNVKDGGNFNKKRQQSGDYRAKIVKVEDTTKKDDTSVKMWLFHIQVGSGTYPYYCTYTAENQLWKIRNLFIAAGINVPKKRVAIDPNKVVGREIGVTLEDDEYDGKKQSNIASTFPTSELTGDAPDGAEDDDDEDDVEEAPKKKKGKKAKEAPQGEDVEAPQGGKKGKKKKAKKVDDVDDSELEELDIDEI